MWSEYFCCGWGNCCCCVFLSPSLSPTCHLWFWNCPQKYETTLFFFSSSCQVVNIFCAWTQKKHPKTWSWQPGSQAARQPELQQTCGFMQFDITTKDVVTEMWQWLWLLPLLLLFQLLRSYCWHRFDEEDDRQCYSIACSQILLMSCGLIMLQTVFSQQKFWVGKMKIVVVVAWFHKCWQIWQKWRRWRWKCEKKII